MGVEGGGIFNSLPYFERGFSQDKMSQGIERESLGDSWISEIVSPAILAEIRAQGYYSEHSDEWIIMEALLARKVEHGPEMDPLVRKRLAALIAAFRILILPNLTPDEQEFMNGLAGTTSINWGAIQIEITPDLKEDVRWIWSKFDLQRPQGVTALIGDLGSPTPGK